MSQMGYDGIGLGLLDLLVRDALLITAQRLRLKIINTLPELNQLPPFVTPQAFYHLGGRRIGVLSLSPVPEELPEAELYARLEPHLQALRAESDVVVLLSQSGLRQDEALARWQAERRWIDLIIGNTEAQDLSQPRIIGRTYLLPTSMRGQYVGLVEIRFEGDEPGFTMRRLVVDTRYEPEPGLRAKIDAFQRAQAEAFRRTSLEPSGIPRTTLRPFGPISSLPTSAAPATRRPIGYGKSRPTAAQ